MTLKTTLLMTSAVWALLAFWTPSAFAQNASALKTPYISANGLFLYRNSNFSKEDDATERNGMDLQEAELQIYADVDPYSRFSLLMSMEPEYSTDVATGKVTESWSFTPEEAFAELLQIPSTTIKIGKFKAAFGKSNLLHTHAYPFVDAPLVNTTLLGDEGLNDVGVSAAVLLPTNWFSELTLQYLRGEGENEEFNSPTPGDGVELAHWKNLWDLSDALTFEVGLSYAGGTNQLGTTTQLSGADLTFKWRPASGGKYQSWIARTLSQRLNPRCFKLKTLSKDQVRITKLHHKGGLRFNLVRILSALRNRRGIHLIAANRLHDRTKIWSCCHDF